MTPVQDQIPAAKPSRDAAPILILVLLACAGIVLSLFAGWREARQYEALERLRLADSADAHFAAARNHLLARERTVATLAALFAPPSLSTPRPLGDLGVRALRLAPDLSSIGWIVEVTADSAAEALKALSGSGIENAHFVDAAGATLATEALPRPLLVLLDIAPDEMRARLGTDMTSFAAHAGAIHAARERRAVTRTPPLDLFEVPAQRGVVLYAPVYAHDGANDGQFAGVLTFAYTAEKLFGAALTARRPDGAFDIRLSGASAGDVLYSVAAGSADRAASGETVSFSRTMTFAGAPLQMLYAARRDLAAEGFTRAAWVTGGGLLLTLGVVALSGFGVRRAARRTQAENPRVNTEERLKALIHELNHRVRNVMSVVQAVVRLSFSSGANLADIQKTCEGRLQALANTMSLLTANDWKNLRLRNLLTEDIIPYAGRVETDGPDITLKARAAQTFGLLFHELAANAARFGAFSVPEGKASLVWTVTGPAGARQFQMSWKETGGPATMPPKRHGFGELLLRRIAPRDLGGRATLTYAAQGLQYDLSAPFDELTDSASGQPA